MYKIFVNKNIFKENDRGEIIGFSEEVIDFKIDSIFVDDWLDNIFIVPIIT